MSKTKVINASSKPIILREGNAGVFSGLATLPKGESMTLHKSASDTYREYSFAVDPETADQKVTLHSNDLFATKEVRIVVEANKISWTGTLGHEERGSKSKESVVTWISRIWRSWRYLSNLVSCL